MTREEAIQILRTQYPHDAVIKEALGLLIPELRESEDEAIRKSIVATIEQCPDDFLNPKNRDRMLAYLEKQKELPFVKDVMLGYPGLYFYDGERMHFRGPTMEEKQKEQKELPLMDGNADLYFDEWNQQKQNPTKRQCFEEGMRHAQRLQKEQKPAEWSEDDEERLKSVIHRIEVQFAGNLYGEGKLDVDWLKSLRPVSKESLQSHWKPSEEQMKMLAMFSSLRCASRQEAATLESLYNDLKRLM